MLRSIIFLCVPLSVYSYAQRQCLCEEYLECKRDKSIEAPTFKQCLRDCSGYGGKMPSLYMKCLKELAEDFDDLLTCTNESFMSGCTSDRHNVVENKDFEEFRRLLGGKLSKTPIEVKEEGIQVFNGCVLECFYLPENKCTRELRCGLNLPTEKGLVENLMDCANDIDENLVEKVGKCLDIVALKEEKPTIEFRRFRRRRF